MAVEQNGPVPALAIDASDSPMTGAGMLRRVNTQRVLDEVFRCVPDAVSRAETARATGLSKQTSSSIFSDLVAVGLLREVSQEETSARGRGRPASFYEADPGFGTVIGIELAATDLRVVIADLHGRVLAEERHRQHRHGNSVVEHLHAVLAQHLSSDVCRHSRVRRIGIGVPGVYDEATDRIRALPGLRVVGKARLRTTLESEFRVPVDIDNDVNLAARAEAVTFTDSTDFAVVFVGSGIGLGLVIDGEIYRGVRGQAGEIGFMIVPSASGQGGVALQDVASASAIEQSYIASRTTDSGTVSTPLRAEEILASVASDARAERVVDSAARALAVALASLWAVLDPDIVVMGGQLGTSPVLVEKVNHALRELADVPISVRPAVAGEFGVCLGAIDATLTKLRTSLAHDLVAFQNL